MVKERGILMSTEMVQAILDDRKRQTRRVVKPQPDEAPKENCKVFNSPYGEPGDVLYVKESWRIAGWDFEDGNVCVEYKDGTVIWLPTYDPNEDSMWLVDQIEKLEAKGYLKRGEENEEGDVVYDFVKPAPWKAARYMPKAFARIWLRITEVGLERLQEISGEDITAEGVMIPVINGTSQPVFELDKNKAINFLPKGWEKIEVMSEKVAAIKKAFWAELWVSINCQDSWKANPLVWVVKFKVMSKSGRPPQKKEVSHG